MSPRSKFEALKDMKKEQETNVHYHETKIQNMVNGYLIWGRSFFFAINSHTSLSFKCKDWWLILASTLFCTFLYFLLFLDAVIMLFRARYQLDLIRMELMGVFQQILVTRNQDDDDVETGELSSSTHGFDDDDFSFHDKMLVLDHVTGTVEKKIHIFFIVCALLAITAIELYTSKCLLCN